MDGDYANNCVEAMRMSNDVIYVEDAIIDEIFHEGRISYVTISYGLLDDFNIMGMNVIRLVVDRNTVIINIHGRRVSVRELRVGNIIYASFSSAMTRSIPPQSRAYMIVVIGEQGNQYPEPDISYIVEDRIIEIDTTNNLVLTGRRNDIMTQIRFVVSNMTDIYDRRGNRIRLMDLRPGQMIRVEHANFMTLSIPPQTTAYQIWVI